MNHEFKTCPPAVRPMSHPLLIVFMLITISGCSTTSRSGDVFRVTIDQPVNLDWGLYQPDSPDRNTLGYQHQGIPGNLAVIPGTTSD